MTNFIQKFFDERAAKWDEGETCSLEKKRALLSKIGIKPGDKVIDIACGTGVISGILHEMTGEKVFAVDLSDKMIEVAKEKYKDNDGISFRQCDFVKDKIEGKYDYAVIYNAYPHFLDVESLSNKLYDVLKENGKFAIVHSMSRKELDSHHSGDASCISRSLRPAKEEAEYFSERFWTEIAEESDSHYLLVFRKK